MQDAEAVAAAKPDSATRLFGLRCGSTHWAEYRTAWCAGGGTGRLMKAAVTGGASFVRLAVNIVSQFVLMMVVARHFDAERFGLWCMLISVPFWLGLIDVGMGNVITTGISYGSGYDSIQPPNLFTAAFAFQSLTAFLFGVGALVYLGANSAGPWLFVSGHSPVSGHEWAAAVAAVTLPSLLAVPFQLARAVYLGYQRGWVPVVWDSLGILGGTIGTLACVSSSSLVLVVLAGTLPIVGARTGSYVQCILEYPSFRPRCGHLSVKAVRVLMANGLSYFAAQIASLGMHQLYPWIVGALLGPVNVGPFMLAYRTVGTSGILVSQFAGPLLPAYGEASVAGDWKWIQGTLRGILTLSTLGGAVMTVAAAVLFHPILDRFTSLAPLVNTRTLALLAAHSFVNTAMTPLSSFLYGLRRPHGQALYTGIYAATVAGVGSYFCRTFQLTGLAAVMSVAVLLCVALPMAIESRLALSTGTLACRKTS